MSRFVALALCLGWATTTWGDDSQLKVQVGDAFPDVPLKAAQIEKAIPAKKSSDTIAISDLKGKTVVIFFYPKALTPGCTVESCGFRDLAEKFPNDVVLLGASADTQAKQQEFITKHMLPFALLCDTELKLIQALGIQMPGGKPVPQRMTFVVAPDGKIAKIYTKVTPKAHPEEVRTFVAEIRKP